MGSGIRIVPFGGNRLLQSCVYTVREMEIADSDLLFIDVDASTPTVKQEQEENADYASNTRRMPSEAQVVFLVDSMEKYPDLARGCIRTASGRQKVRRVWDQIRLRLNTMEGIKKNSSQWMKYWTDKKTFVKKKAAEGELELTSVEEKILYLCVGEPPKLKRNTNDLDNDLSTAQFDLSDNDLPHEATTPGSLNTPTDHNKSTTSKCQTQQCQSSFDRILKVEERRLSMEQTNSQLMRTILEQSAQRERTILEAVRSLNERLSERNERDAVMAGALKCLGEGLLALSKVINNK